IGLTVRPPQTPINKMWIDICIGVLKSNQEADPACCRDILFANQQIVNDDIRSALGFRLNLNGMPCKGLLDLGDRLLNFGSHGHLLRVVIWGSRPEHLSFVKSDGVAIPDLFKGSITFNLKQDKIFLNRYALLDGDSL